MLYGYLGGQAGRYCMKRRTAAVTAVALPRRAFGVTVSDSTGRRLDEVIHAQTRVADLPPVRRWIGLLPGTSLIDILPRLGGMFDGLVGDPNWVAENDPGILTFAHGQQGYRRRCFAVRCGRVREPPQRLRPTARSTSQGQP